MACLNQIAISLQHRGPDAQDRWLDEPAGVGLSHNRLSILDLSPAGAQPMASANGRYVLSYNGEIYNYLALRKELEARSQTLGWRGHSDTEVLLAAIEAWGVPATLGRLRGMFAIALWDREDRRLVLARDAMGEKPLYVGFLPENGLVFASELKGLLCHSDFSTTLDRDAIAQCVRHGFIPAPRTLYQDGWKVAPGSYVEIEQNKQGELDIRAHAYFDLITEAQSFNAKPFAGSADEAANELEALLGESVRQQMISDVPLGAFLSGGVDSSTIAALMQSNGSGSVSTFALGFEEDAENEADHAREIAQHLGSEHHEIVLTGADALGLVETMPSVYDEPFADPSQLPTYLVCQFARQHVTVCLSGDGADELFGGYGRYHAVRQRWADKAKARAHRFLESAYCQSLEGLTRTASTFGLEHMAGRDLRVASLRLAARSARSGERSALAAYERGYTHLENAHELVIGARPTETTFIEDIESVKGLSTLGQLTLLDMHRYLPDDILVKVDRAAMAHSLETRVPFLDIDVVRFALSLPDDIKMAGNRRKGVLKAVLDRHVPQRLWDRPKQGFGIPVDRWLRGPFRELASDLFSTETLRSAGVLDPDLVQRFWGDFLNGNKRLKTLLWSLLVLQLTLTSKSR
jgi:asparagine synthase (glutamine-hydrolysing)